MSAVGRKMGKCVNTKLANWQNQYVVMMMADYFANSKSQFLWCQGRVHGAVDGVQ